MNFTVRFKLLILVIIFNITSGCSSLGVEPWERDLLAKKNMLPSANPLESAADDHTYFSKEASAGGRNFGGGGCGCN